MKGKRSGPQQCYRTRRPGKGEGVSDKSNGIKGVWVVRDGYFFHSTAGEAKLMHEGTNEK